MQAHIPEERKIIQRQLEVQLHTFREKRVVNKESITDWEISIAGEQQSPSRGPKSGWEKYEIGTHWGDNKADYTVWFRTRTKVPKTFLKTGCYVELGLAPAREALVFLNGTPSQGLSENHTTLRLHHKDHLEKPFQILIEAYTEFPRSPLPQYHGCFRFAEIRCIDQTVDSLWWDLKVILETLKVLDPSTQNYQRLQELIGETMQMLHPLPTDAVQLRTIARKAASYLKEGLKQFPSESGRGKLRLTGHSHIDTAWLWSLVETQRKCGRTFSTVLSLMETYPEFCFSQGQPQLYQFTKEHYPELYETIRKRVKQGRWDPAGAPWVEMDSNISGGEALVRQMLYGNLFYEKEFGVRSNVCWLPDAFGYNWNLPQILKKSGIDLFVTTKISWSEVTDFPYSIFNWEGADGSSVIGLMPPLNYNGMVTISDLREHWDRVKQKNRMEELIYSFGYGDGGGGPTLEMIETARRVENLTGVPQCRYGTVTQYCQELLASVNPKDLPTWNGELYLELHRGCQTSQGRIKRQNREMENRLRDTEFLASMAYLCGEPYPAERLLPLWWKVLTNQFHDILPGSSVHEVYEEADQNFTLVMTESSRISHNALHSLLSQIDTSGEGQAIVAFNTLGWKRNDPVLIKTDVPTGEFHVVDAQGEVVPHQVINPELADERILIAPACVLSVGYGVFHLVPGSSQATQKNPLKISKTRLENSFFKIQLNPKGHLTSVYDKRAQREVLASGCQGNLLQMFHDEPHCWDAWDVDFNFAENGWLWDDLQSCEVVETGPVRGALRLVRKTGKSTLTQKIILYADTPRIDFETEVDWHEHLVLLKAAFPVNIRSSYATYEIQFGAIERPTHRNTPHDRARFEVPHLRWADLSEGNYGVALANDCKYGFDTEGNVLRLSLLRAPTSPDPEADKGYHRFTYSLIPHLGDWRQGQVVRKGMELNLPMHTIACDSSSGKLSATMSWIHCEQDNIIIEAVKKAEKSQALIVRLYESCGYRGTAKLSFGFPVKSVSECNLMEEGETPVRTDPNGICLDFTPYEIKTLRVVAG